MNVLTEIDFNTSFDNFALVRSNNEVNVGLGDTQNYINGGNPSKLQNTSKLLTVACKIKFDDVATPAFQGIIGKAGAAAWSSGYGLIYVQSTSKLTFWINQWNANFTDVTFTDTDDWHNVVGVYDGTNISLWLDGVRQSQSAYSTAIVDGANFEYGRLSLATFEFDGKMSECKVFNSALSDYEVQRIWQNVSRDNLVLHYKVDEGTGTTITDYSNSPSNGTLNNPGANFWTTRINQHLGTMLNCNINVPLSLNREYEQKTLDATWANFPSTYDGDRYFNEILTDSNNEAVKNREIRVKKTDNTLLQTFNINNYELPKHLFKVSASDKTDSLERDVTAKINATDYTDTNVLVKDNLGKVISVPYNTINNSTACSVICYLVDTNTNPGATSNNYVIADRHISSITTLKDSAGATFTAGTGFPGSSTYALVNHTDGRAYVSLPDNVGLPYVIANLVADSPELKPQEIIRDLIQKYDIGTLGASNTTLDTYLNSNSYTAANTEYLISEEKTGGDILKEFCDSFELEWYTDENGNIEFTWIDVGNLSSATYTLTEKEIISFKRIDYNIEGTPPPMVNSLTYKYAFYQDKNTTERIGTTDVDTDTTSIRDYGELTNELNYPFLQNSTVADQTASDYITKNKEPVRLCEVDIPLTTIGNDVTLVDVKLGDVMDITHPDALTTTSRLYRVINININFESDIASLILQDIDDFQ